MLLGKRLCDLRAASIDWRARSSRSRSRSAATLFARSPDSEVPHACIQLRHSGAGGRADPSAWSSISRRQFPIQRFRSETADRSSRRSPVTRVPARTLVLILFYQRLVLADSTLPAASLLRRFRFRVRSAVSYLPIGVEKFASICSAQVVALAQLVCQDVICRRRSAITASTQHQPRIAPARDLFSACCLRYRHRRWLPRTEPSSEGGPGFALNFVASRYPIVGPAPRWSGCEGALIER